MWTRGDQAAVSTLVLMMVWATAFGSPLFCNTTKVEKLQARDLIGNVYMRLANLPDEGTRSQLGFKLSVTEINGKENLNLQVFFWKHGTCSSWFSDCVVNDNYCEYSSGRKIYFIFHNEDYDVTFGTPGNTVKILTRYTGGSRIDVEKLPQDMLSTIADKCDMEVITNAFYTRRFDPWYTAPTCDKPQLSFFSFIHLFKSFSKTFI
nr:conotoxin precursor Cver07 [Conus judaeus]